MANGSGNAGGNVPGTGGGGPVNQQVNVQFQASGLGKIKAGWADFMGDLLEPIAVLAAGGTKVQAAWAGIRGVFITKVLGPLGMVTGAAAGLLLVTRKLISEWKTYGLASAKAVETLTLQFKPLLGSMDLAKKRAREIFDFSVKTPFKFADLAEGNKILQSLTRGALAGKEGMELVGDAASVAGSDFADTARQVGRLYDGLMSGRPVGEAAFRLQELGLISGQTRTQIEAMQAANEAGSKVWAVAAADLERAKGAMETLSESLEGLESTYADTRQQLEAGFGQGFLEGEKVAIKSATATMDAMVPVAQTLGRNIGQINTWWEQFKAKIKGVVTGSKEFSGIITVAAVAVTGFAAAILLAAGANLAKFLWGIRQITIAQQAMTAATMASTGAQTVAQVVVGNLRTAFGALKTALTEVVAGKFLSAAASLKLAATETIVAFRTNALVAAQGVLKGAFLLARTAALTLVGALRAVAVAMLTTPIGIISTLLVAAGTALLAFYTSAKKAREELEAYAASAKAVAANLAEQARAIRTVTDLRKAEADAARELSEAYLMLEEATAAGDEKRAAIAQKLIAQLRQTQEEIRGKSGKTELGEEQVGREDTRKEREKEAKRAREDDEAARGDASAVAVARRRVQEGEAKRQAAQVAEAEEKAVQAAKEKIRRGLEDAEVRRPALEGKRESLKAQIEKNERLAQSQATAGPMGGPQAAGVAAAARLEAEKLKAELAEVEDVLGGIEQQRRANAAAEAQVALQSASELAVLKEKLSIYEQMEGAKKKVDDAQRKLNEAEAATGQDEAKKQEEIAKARRELADAQGGRDRALALAGVAGVKDWQPIDRQNNERRRDEIIKQREEDLDPVANEERARALRDAELALAQGRIDAESKIADLRLKGYEREAAMLEFAKRDLELRRQRGRIDDEAYAKEKAMLDERKAALERQTQEARAEMNGALETANLRRREEAARRDGRQEEAEALRKQAEAVEDAATRRDAVREAEALPEGEREDYVKRRMEEARARRGQDWLEGETQKKLGRSRTDAERGGAAAEIEARAAAMRGSAQEARRIREDAARQKDDVDRAEKQRDYRGQGYTDKQADRMADEDVKRAQAQRIMDEMAGYKGSVVASSLAQVGGGGNVAGTDPTVKLQERMVKLLEDIADSSKDNVDRVW